jgi:hypothetical protein
MSEQEFELYLKLLARCLGLTSRQREQIADELRDHLEERLEELAGTGVPREQAVLQAIDEFGDAAALAGHFTTIAHLKRRRFLMRLSLGSVALLVVALFVAFAFWPENHAIRGLPQVLAQNKSEPKASAKTPPAATRKTEPSKRQRKPSLEQPNGPPKIPAESRVADEHPLSSDIGQNPRIEEALEMRTNFAIEPQPFKDAIDYIAQRYQIPILFDTKVLEDASIDAATEVKMPYSGLKLRQLLTLLLQQMAQPLAFYVEDGILRISTVEAVNQHRYVVVYDCRDLIHLKSMYPGAATNAHSHATESVGTLEGPGDVPKPSDASTGPAKANKKPERAAKTPCLQDEIPLIRVIKYAGDQNDWEEEEGGGPKIIEIGGLLVVNQNPIVHEQIKRILSDLRRMRKEGAYAAFDNGYTAPVSTSPQAGKPGGL